jgi:hypothetical protein
MQDAGFTAFLMFGCIWIVMVAAAVVIFMRSEKISFQFDGWALVVVLPIMIPIVLALGFNMIYHH